MDELIVQAGDRDGLDRAGRAGIGRRPHHIDSNGQADDDHRRSHAKHLRVVTHESPPVVLSRKQ